MTDQPETTVTLEDALWMAGRLREQGCEILTLRDEIERLRAREARLLDIIRCYNSDDALFDHEKVVRDVSLPKLCEDCRKNWADWPSKLCPGCEAYREHTGAL